MPFDIDFTYCVKSLYCVCVRPVACHGVEQSF